VWVGLLERMDRVGRLESMDWMRMVENIRQGEADGEHVLVDGK